MGFLGKLVKGVGKVGKGVLKVAGGIGKKVAPLAGLIPGVGTVAGGLIGGASSLASDVGNSRKISLGNALKSGASGALSGLAGAKLLGGKGLPGLLSKAGGLIKGGSPAPTPPGLPDAPPGSTWQTVNGRPQLIAAGDMQGDVASGMPSAGGGLLDTIKNFALKNPAKIAGVGLGIANTISAGKQSGEADAARKVALSRLQNRPPIDLGDTFQDPSNPYAQRQPGTSRKTALRSLMGAY